MQRSDIRLTTSHGLASSIPSFTNVALCHRPLASVVPDGIRLFVVLVDVLSNNLMLVSIQIPQCY